MKANDLQLSKAITKIAQELKKVPEMSPPEWSMYVKTGVHKERPPVDGDWWYIRSASIMLKINKLGPVGVNKLKRKYGGRKNRGVKPEKRYDASGNIIRKILQNLEKSGFIQQTTKGTHKGRILTSKGMSFIDKSSK